MISITPLWKEFVVIELYSLLHNGSGDPHLHDKRPFKLADTCGIQAEVSLQCKSTLPWRMWMNDLARLHRAGQSRKLVVFNRHNGPKILAEQFDVTQPSSMLRKITLLQDDPDFVINHSDLYCAPVQ
jgi:hypothetical protein